MRKDGVIIAVILFVAGAILITFSPTGIPMAIIGLMCVLLIAGYVFGMFPLLKYTHSFINARKRINRICEIQTNEPWIALSNIEALFLNDDLDRLFDEYRQVVNEKESLVDSFCDIEDIINEDVIALKSWKGLIMQLPSTFTGLGILGTFIGLLLGISSIGFSSVTVAIGSIQTLLEGVRTAFYTSVAGVILSILFNLLYKFVWNRLEKRMYAFFNDFHKYIIPEKSTLIMSERINLQRKIVERLDTLIEYNNKEI